MTTGYETVVARFRVGDRTLDLNADPYRLDDIFYPPGTTFDHLIGSGVSGNRWGGGTLIDERAVLSDYPLPIQIRGTKNSEIRKAARVIESWLSQAGVTPDRPLIFEYKPDNSIPFDPVWGQYGAANKFEIVHGQVPKVMKSWGKGTIRDRTVNYKIQLKLQPFIEGIDQLVAEAGGGIIEDTIGLPLGFSRGIQNPKAGTNRIPNPVFMFPDTPEQGWTATSTLNDIINRDTDFVAFGNTSMIVTGYNASIVNNRYTCTITERNGNNRLSVYVKRPDRGIVTTSDCDLIFDGVATTPNIVAVANGWYRVYQDFSGSGASVTVGIRVGYNRRLYIDGFQVEDSDTANTLHPTPLIWGDALGCSWAGTVNNSVGSRAVGDLRLTSGDYGKPAGSARLVLRMNYSSSDLVAAAEDRCLMSLYVGSTYQEIYYDTSAGELVFQTGADFMGVAFSWDYGDVLILHFTWDDTLKAIYSDGVLLASNSAYAAALFDTVGIGQDYLGADNLETTILDMTIWDRSLSATQVLADALAMIEVAGEGDQISPIPWLWTKAGDSTVDNCDDSTRDNWCVVGGIPGSYPAVTTYNLTFGRVPSFYKRMYLSNLTLDYHIDPEIYLYDERQGTVDSGSSGGEYLAASLGLSGSTWTAVDIVDHYQQFEGKEFYVFHRFAEPVNYAYAFSPGFLFGNNFYTGKVRQFLLATTSQFRLLRSNSMIIPRFLAPPGKFPYLMGLGFSHSRPGEVTPRTYWLDFTAIMFRPMEEFKVADAGGDFKDMVYKAGDYARAINDSTGGWGDKISREGDPVHLLPNTLNQLRVLMGNDDVSEMTITDTLKFDPIIVRPRWGVM